MFNDRAGTRYPNDSAYARFAKCGAQHGRPPKHHATRIPWHNAIAILFLSYRNTIMKYDKIQENALSMYVLCQHTTRKIFVQDSFKTGIWPEAPESIRP
jgi:hypothetical protein